MSELIGFALKRRLLNKATLTFYLLTFLIVGSVVNADRLYSLFVKPTSLRVQATDGIKEFVIANPDFNIIVDSSSTIKIQQAENQYVVETPELLGSDEQQLISTLLQAYHINQMEKVPEFYLAYYDRYLAFNLEFVSTAPKPSSLSGLAFWLVTSIYFMMIGYATVVANEVVYEKTTKLLELLLSVVTVKTHFYAKIVIGWLTVIIQLAMIGIITLGWFWWRFILDKGQGLCEQLIKWQLLDSQFINFNFINNYIVWSDVWLPCAMTLIILFLGMVCVQLWMVILSSFVTSVEEAANWQSPIYILLMVVYYLSLGMQSPVSLKHGLGFYLSFLPLTSMLMMPSRILLVGVPNAELGLCIVIQLLLLLVSLALGEQVYRQGIMISHKKSQSLFQWLKSF